MQKTRRDSKPNRLRELRNARGLKLYDIAATLRVDPSTVSRWERGGQIRDDDHMFALAALYGVSLEYMLGADLREAAA